MAAVIVSEFQGCQQMASNLVESSEYGDWELAGRLSLKIAEIYIAAMSQPAAVVQDASLVRKVKGVLVEAGPTALPQDLWALSHKLILLLAGELNRLSGREPLRSGDWRVIIYCLGGARTLREAIARCADAFDAIDGRCGCMRLRLRGDMAELDLDSLRRDQTPACCAIDLEGIACFHGLFGWMIGRRLPIGTVALHYDVAVFAALDLPKFPEELLLQGGWTGFSFPAPLLDYPVMRGVDELIDWPRHSFLFNADVKTHAGDIAAQVRHATVASLRANGRLLAFEILSEQLGTSPATLRRRLTDAGTSFRRIRSSCRRELALELLRRADLSIEAIAERLDFCDSDAFRMAFKGWVGASPSAYRSRRAESLKS